MLDPKKKQSVIKKFQLHDGDTGSSEVQIGILSAEIQELIDHLKTHPKDHSSRRGLLRKVSSRRSLLRYLKKENAASYDELIKKLKLKAPRVLHKQGAMSGTTAAEEAALEEELELEEKPNESIA